MHLQIIVCCIVLLLLLYPRSRSHITSFASTQRHRSPLPDLCHSLFPDFSHCYYMGDWMVIALCVAFIVYCIWTQDWKTFVYVLTVWIAGMVIKMIMTSVTVLPDPSGSCHVKAKSSFGFCHDLLPSGHMILAFAIFVGVWPRLQSKWWKALFVSTIVMLWFFTISTKNHYTIDTLVSLFVVLGITHLIPRE